MFRHLAIWIPGIFFFSVISFFVYTFGFKYPIVGDPPQIVQTSDARVIARGKYLARHVAVCIDCHSDRDWSKFSGPPKPGTWGKGGARFDKKLGFPGTVYSPNITPVHLGDWTDSELAHAIVSGISKDGRVLHPVMPYTSYNNMSQDDLAAIVAYIRMLLPISNSVRKSHINFPINLFIKATPKPYSPKVAPRLGQDQKSSIAYGEYLAKMASCVDCHTRFEKNKRMPDLYAGGSKFLRPDGSGIWSSNITPDKETGIGGWTKAKFVARFKAYDLPYDEISSVSMDRNTIMPWSMYAGMTEADLGAIFDYLSSVEPIRNVVND